MGTWVGLLSQPVHAHDAIRHAPPRVGDAVRGVESSPSEDGAGEVLVEGHAEDPGDPLATAGSVTVLEVDETLAATADVASLVDGAAGTTVVQLGGLGDFSAVSLRGSTLRQVQVHLDGIPLNPDGGDVVNLSELPLGAFSQVEVWRSAPPPGLLASPIGGVVNLVTGEEPRATRLSATGGSLGTARATGFGSGRTEIGGADADGIAFVDAFRTDGDFGYFADQGTIHDLLDDRRLERANNDKRQLSTHVRGRLGDRRLRLTLLDAACCERRVSRTRQQPLLPGPSRDPTEPRRRPGGRSAGTDNA